MKTIASFSLLILSVLNSFAQPIARESIEDEVIGWMKVYHFKGIKEIKKVDDKVYSAAQLSICDTLANWIQASYIPTGGLGDVKKAVSEEISAYNQHTAAKPQSYGAYSKTYFELKYNSSHKLEPATNSHVYWGVFANLVPGDWPIKDICSRTQYYFTMPTSETEEDDERMKKLLDIGKEANVKPYITLWIKNMGYGRGRENVLLCKDNKSPFIRVTNGEYLKAWEAAIPRYYETQKKLIIQQEQGVQARIDISVKQLDAKIERLVAGLKKNQEKYSNRLTELAMSKSQPSIQDLGNGRDVFSGHELTEPESDWGRMPVYKIDPAMAELCKKDKPQWILISWDYYPIDPLEKHQHEAIINNFNFDYVYNFFFYPEKVKGKPYQPMRSPSFKETIVTTEKSVSAKNAGLDKNVHFFEDFSTTGVGKKPAGWAVKTNGVGAECTVAALDGIPDKWALLAGTAIKPSTLKKPLPENFTLAYDVIVPEDFTWGAKGLVFLLSKEKNEGVAESYIRLKLRPGSGGADGEAELETKFPAGYTSGTKWYVATGFSNNKKVNRMNVEIKKNGEKLQLLLDKKMIIEYGKCMPADMLFNALSFDMGRSDGETEGYYISNIKITKD